MADALRWAHEADPGARLYVNDFNIEGRSAKTDGMLALLSRLRRERAPIDGVGLQTHLTVSSSPTRAELRSTMRRYAALGLAVDISEMDVASGVGARAEREQARVYREVAAACRAPAGVRAVHHLGIHGRLHLARHRPAAAAVHGRRRAQAGVAGDPILAGGLMPRMTPRYFLDLPEEPAPIPWDVDAGPRPERADTRYFGGAFREMRTTPARPRHRRVPDLGHPAAACVRRPRRGGGAGGRERADPPIRGPGEGGVQELRAPAPAGHGAPRAAGRPPARWSWPSARFAGCGGSPAAWTTPACGWGGGCEGARFRRRWR